ncbi:hypothetical protein CgunFtcFv8_021497 [Champsocephalus gunnari]|nr:hypothetical protein CgunFtcFv8_021497 [Champsocephalus gunnari]
MEVERLKYKLCSLVSSPFQHFLSCTHRNTLASPSLSRSPRASLCFSNWCVASTHQLSGEGPIAELRASQLLWRQAAPRGPTQTSRSSRRAPPRSPDDGGSERVKRQGAPPLNGSDKYEQLRATGSAWGGGEDT